MHHPGTALSSAGKPALDPITVEIVRGALRSAQLEMGSLLERTAMSPVIREKQDYFTGLVDRDLNLLIGTKMPSGGRIVPPVLKQYPISAMRPGDIFLYNDCYGTNGAVSHSPDMVFVTPVFIDDVVEGFVFAWAHFIDIGGSHSSSTTPDTENIFQEGVIVPIVRLCQDGIINDDIFRMFVSNSRFPEIVRGDVRSMIAAVQLGERRLREILERFGVERAYGAFDSLIASTERTVHQRMHAAFPPGRYRFADVVDDDGMGSGPLAVRMTMESDGERLVLDATASDDQTRGPVNFLMSSVIPSMVFGLFMTAESPDLLPNEGLLRNIDELKLRPGSILQPKYPAPLGQRATTSRRVHTTCYGLVGVADPAKGHASSSAYSLGKISGIREGSGKSYLKTMGFGVGQGARPYADGIDAVYYIAQRNFPVEFAEMNYPVRIRRYGIHLDSGGPGRWRGGCGIVREVELLGDSATLMLRLTNCIHPPFGINGGMSGRAGRFTMNPGTPRERELPYLAEGVPMERGDILRIETPGGGGVGHPFDRPVDLVLRDVLGEFVGIESARDDYGVIVDLDAEAVDLAATEALRRERRWPTKLVHRNGYYDEDGWYEASFKLKETA
ncbi:MAG: hydantoinase B/oxoprolinase family protein [Chelatococcus sp.]|jgi:N-methylhydantoinase B|uniref:hydantoinase B/oxoprolinase family protein n=1 Tax=Chelatococcus sp. TaxID=1953771 RepID=UPI0025BCA959|nr:hydantoinase B/oxoprolinase family protein [Chelatococcus sp.]MBX3538490.1 hydantoinase B/oxoprolinase family protein [Chelatococcus sp.]